MNPHVYKRLFFGLILIGVVIRLYIIFLPEAELLTRWGSDDLYYYSQIAGHVANGDGFTFDGMHPTNGFQPLFMFLLIPFGRWMLHDVYSSWVIVSLMVTFLTVVAAVQWRKFIEDVSLNPTVGLLFVAVLMLHPKIVSVTLNGTEGALSFLMIGLSFRAFLWIQRGERLIHAMLVFALLVITRLEFSVLLFMLFLFGMWKKQEFRTWLLIALGPVVTFSSWLLINLWTFGSVLPSSGAAKSIASEAIPFSFFDSFKGVLGTTLYAESALSFVTLGLVILGLFTLVKDKRSDVIQWTVFLAISSVVLISPMLIQLHGFRDWYLVPEYVLMSLMASFGCYFLIVRLKKWAWSLLLLPVFIWAEAGTHPRKMNGDVAINAAPELKKLIAGDAHIGAFNAGVPSAALGSWNAVVNLDGVVNNSILPYLRDKNLRGYLKNEKIAYIFDIKGSIDFFMKNFGQNVDWEVVKEFKRQGQHWCLIRIK